MTNQNQSVPATPGGTVEELKNYLHRGEQWGIFDTGPVTQRAAISDASGGATVDAEARTALNALLQACRDLGIIDT